MLQEPVRGGYPDPSFFSLSGMDQARRAMRGQMALPPLHHLVGHRLTQVGSGTATGTQQATPWLQTVDGTVDFRFIMESAAYYAALTGAPPATAVQASALAINYMRPCTIDSGTLIARARTLNSGPTFTLVEVTVEDAEGRGVAHGTATYVLRAMDPAPPEAFGEPVPFTAPAYGMPDPWQRPLSWSPQDLGFPERSLCGILRALADHELELPPLDALLGFRFLDVDDGCIALAAPASEWWAWVDRHISPALLSSLAWHAGGGAHATLVPAGSRLSVLDQTVTIFRRVPADGRDLIARGRVTHRQGDLHLSEAEITDSDGNTVAVGHQTSLLTTRRKRTGGAPERVLATVLFTDIVASTEQAAQLGDARWTDLLGQHHTVVRKQLDMFRGREVKTTGDGFLATFDSPGRAVQAARAVRDAVQRLGIEVRVGLHTGECEMTGPDVAGIAVHIASRIQSLAAPGEILVSGTVRDLVAGSGLSFSDRGRQALKGLDGDWPVFAVDR